jgi:tetratricopeptide (TPR) repeat protein
MNMPIYYKHGDSFIKTIVVFSVIFFLCNASFIERIYSLDDSEVKETFECVFELNTNGYVHEKITFELQWRTKDCWTWGPLNVENFIARETETGTPIKVETADEGDGVSYTLIFGEMKNIGFRFTVEYDSRERIEEKSDDVYYFYCGWWAVSQVSLFDVTVILPKNHELLYTNYLDPIEIISQSGHQHIIIKKIISAEETFRIGAMFSQKGIQLIKRADNRYHLKKYDEARAAYRDAIKFYSQFSKLFGKNRSEFIGELQKHVDECEKIIHEELIISNTHRAEETFNQAVTALNEKDYEKARALFIEAQNLYDSVGNLPKKSECQDYIDQCTAIIENRLSLSEAQSLLDEGISLFEDQEYEEANLKFKEALTKFSELGEGEKMEECEEWIASCEEALHPPSSGICLGTTLIGILIFSGLLLQKQK